MKGFLKVFFAVMVLCALVAGCGSGGGGGGTTSVDLIRPEISQTLPVNGAANVGTNTRIVITFSEPMNETSVNKAFSLTTAGGTKVTGTLSLSGATATFIPSPALDPITPYTAKITTDATDTNGNSLVSELKWTFTTGGGPDNTGPTVLSYAPNISSVNVGINTSIAFSFSTPMDPASVENAFSLTLQGDTTKIKGTFRFVGQTAVFKPDALLEKTKTYAVSLSGAATALALPDNHLVPKDWVFTTSSEQDSAPPTAGTTSPTGTAASLRPDISVSFDEPITPFDYGYINNAPTTVMFDYSTNTVRMTPTVDLPANKPYEVTIRVTDLCGNQISAPIKWNFSTP